MPQYACRHSVAHVAPGLCYGPLLLRPHNLSLSLSSPPDVRKSNTKMSSDDDSSFMSSDDGLTMWPSNDAEGRSRVTGSHCAHCTYLIRSDPIINSGQETTVGSEMPSQESLKVSKARYTPIRRQSEGWESLRQDYGTSRAGNDRRMSAPATLARYTPTCCENYHCPRCCDEEKDAEDEAFGHCGACLKAFLTMLLMALWVFIVIIMVWAVSSG
jgi:hypothetical protein